MTFPGGSSQNYQYDALLRLERLSAPDSGMDYQYTYDNVSNILTKTTEHGNYNYEYDDVYWLTSADNPTQDDETYAYDGVGNRETASGVSGTITHNANNELTIYGDLSYDYDTNGNMIRKSVGTVAVNYIYDPADRLIRIEDELSGTVIAEYSYDPFGRRLWKDVDGISTYFFYADEGLVAEYDSTGNELKAYGYQPDSTWTTDPLFQKIGSSYYWYQNDHLGTPQKLIDSTGNVVWDARDDAFGKVQIVVNTLENNLRFPGQYEDAETGLYYNYHRYYDPNIGRYLRVDPLGLAGGINVFTYAHNTPLNAVDPLGLAVGELTLGGFAIAGPPGALAGALVGLGLVGGGYAVCRAAGGCRVEELPQITVGAPPSAIPGYPEIRPISPFFPPIPFMCDPGDVDRTNPIETIGQTDRIKIDHRDFCEYAADKCGKIRSPKDLWTKPIERIGWCIAWLAACT